MTAVSLGIHQAIVDETTAFVSSRHRYGEPLYELPSIRLKLGQMTSRLMTARLIAYHAVHLLDRGMACDADLMNAKLYNVVSAMDSARNARRSRARRTSVGEHHTNQRSHGTPTAIDGDARAA